ncbi:hypothetical protein CEY16_09515 [Halalkalibacillus sediminis]|uniref:Uncharacterized protein n=1 Tax=Halalkalibacillus sediminis TaxID=2018042 RepID=A0A2I0QUX6_9BACI|nr:hypothetical protein [Halalkalibacillus sediminis]PKR78141.1 hypothetical protein CEY16_09515 [Halalkalibacillus sediminis]
MKIIILLASLAMITNCVNETNDNDVKGSPTKIENRNPTPGEILSQNEDADIFMLKGIVYQNAENLQWVIDENPTSSEQVGEIESQTSDAESFKNGTATDLPVGTKIYETNVGKGIYIAEVDEEEKLYLALIEG